jgi:hypothetical protein
MVFPSPPRVRSNGTLEQPAPNAHSHKFDMRSEVEVIDMNDDDWVAFAASRSRCELRAKSQAIKYKLMILQTKARTRSDEQPARMPTETAFRLTWSVRSACSTEAKPEFLLARFTHTHRHQIETLHQKSFTIQR